ncbi:CoB--CoM heterodisulfide reductase iron-sulfur subunit A family protein [archaeon]|nr:MAG: CoB--CoM heterodisulfide reductase iron-sulfur subunit A family protein [archaeon]
MNKSTAVIGAGISGMQAALSLANRGIRVHLIEKTSSIGGIMARLDKTMPTLDCSICILSPFMLSVARNPLIEVHTLTDVVGATKHANGYMLTLNKRPRYVDIDKCTGCRECMAKCPVKISLPNEEKFGTVKAIHFDFDQAIPAVPHIEADRCLMLTKGKCGNCAKFCDKDAVDFEQQPEEVAIDVSSVVLATGARPYDPTDRPEYGYGKYKNVITAMELERLLSASGPTEGEVVRASDKKHPRRVAFINCVGSRDHRVGRGYCSKVCCMYGIKEALLVRDHDEDAEVTIFYIDIRASGKGYEEFFQNAKERIRFVRARPGEIHELENDDLLVRYEDTEAQEVREETFDMVVLNTALVPTEDTHELSRLFGVSTNEYGFFTPPADISKPIDTDAAGVYVIGACQGPNDITDCVSQSIGPVAKGYEMAGDIKLPERGELPGAPDGPPRVGVFVCHCGKNIGRYVDVPSVAEYARSLPGVVYAEDSMFTCSDQGQSSIKKKIKEHKLNRVVVAACSPKTHEATFQEALEGAGLNPYLLEMANIRNQCSWVHSKEHDKATEKAKDLVKMAVAKARLLEPLYEREVNVNPRSVVIGGGVTGLISALELSQNGFAVSLIERSSTLGGKANLATNQPDGSNPSDIVQSLSRKIKEDDDITVHFNSEVTAVDGFVGDFTLTFSTPEGEAKVPCGTVVIATGFDFANPASSGFECKGDVISEERFIGRLKEGRLEGKDFVFILCVGSRNEKHPHCSRFCCLSSLNQIRELLETHPDANVTVLYRDIRAYGYHEDIYKDVADRGARFIRYSPESMPRINYDNNTLMVFDTTSDTTKHIHFDSCVLERGAIPSKGTDKLRQLFKVSSSPSGFFAEAHLKLAPLDTALDGVFIAGGCQYPKTISESISQGVSAAGRAAIVMGRKVYEVIPIAASIDPNRCVACRLCEKLCPYSALRLSDDGTHMDVITVSCKGCGTCAAFCPSNAITLSGFTYGQEKEMIKAALEEDSE